MTTARHSMAQRPYGIWPPPLSGYSLPRPKPNARRRGGVWRRLRASGSCIDAHRKAYGVEPICRVGRPSRRTTWLRLDGPTPSGGQRVPRTTPANGDREPQTGRPPPEGAKVSDARMVSTRVQPRHSAYGPSRGRLIRR